MNKGSIKIFIYIFIIFIIGLLIVINLTFFKINNIVIKKVGMDFILDESLLLDYLNIKKGSFIWFYNTKAIQEKLSKFYFFNDTAVKKIYPDTILIELKMREPIAFVYGGNGNFYLADKDGYIYSNAFKKKVDLPLIIFEKNSFIEPSVILKGSYKELLNVLEMLHKKNKVIYDNLSQIEVNEKGSIKYIVNFKTYDLRVYLKNFINVDAIIDSLALAFYMDFKKENGKRAYYTENSFAIF